MIAALVFIVAALGLVACTEIPQDARKPFAGPAETQSYSGGKFNGNKGAYEKNLVERANTQDEYLRTGDAKK
jgi:hypothetical protein